MKHSWQDRPLISTKSCCRPNGSTSSVSALKPNCEWPPWGAAREEWGAELSIHLDIVHPQTGSCVSHYPMLCLAAPPQFWSSFRKVRVTGRLSLQSCDGCHCLSSVSQVFSRRLAKGVHTVKPHCGCLPILPSVMRQVKSAAEDPCFL